MNAQVTRISPVIDAETGTFKITVEIEDAARRIKPGMFARINIVQDHHEDALQVPRIAVVGDGDESAVFVVDNGLAVRRPVTTGISQKGMVEIVSGLSDHEPVVTVGQSGLKDGSKVTVINAATSTPMPVQGGTREMDDAAAD